MGRVLLTTRIKQHVKVPPVETICLASSFVLELREIWNHTRILLGLSLLFGQTKIRRINRGQPVIFYRHDHYQTLSFLLIKIQREVKQLKYILKVKHRWKAILRLETFLQLNSTTKYLMTEKHQPCLLHYHLVAQ